MKQIKIYHLSIILMISSCLFFSILAGIIKYLSNYLHPFEQAFFRNFFTIFLFLPYIFRTNRNPFKSSNKKKLLVRSFFGAVTMLLLFWSYTLIPLSQAVAISFTTPLFIFLGGIVVMKEKVSSKNVIALVFGFIITLIIIRPDLEIQFGTYIAIIASITHAITGLIVKDLTKTESVFSIMFFMIIFMTPLTLIPSVFFWSLPDNLIVWLFIFLLAVFGTLGNFCWTKSLSLSNLTSIMPFEFSKLVFATLIGFFFFKEGVDAITIVGGIMLILCNIIISRK